MTDRKPRTVGEVVKVSEGSVVTRPDGTEHTVSGGAYVLDAEGTFVVDGSEVEVKAS